MTDDLIRMTATEAVARSRKREISPLELIDAAEARIAEVEPHVNALPALCFDRAREHARRLMADQSPAAAHEAGWLGGLPVSIKDLTDVAGCARRMARRSSGTMCRRARIRWWSGSNAKAASWWRNRTRRSSAPVAPRFQWGSNSDVRRGDGAELEQSFPFRCEFQVPVDDPWELDLAEPTFGVDTSEWREAMGPDEWDEGP